MLNYVRNIELLYNGAARLRGVLPGTAPEFRLFVEEIYSEDDWFAHHVLTLGGEHLQTVDERYGENRHAHPIPLPNGTAIPGTVRSTAFLNFAGVRLRGMREAERVAETARALGVRDKLAIIARFGLTFSPMMLLGTAESTVLAEAQIGPELFVVCRRMRVVYALPQPETDRDRQPYDYESLTFYVAHPVTLDEDPTLETAFAGLPGVVMDNPMDCMAAGGYLLVAEGGSEAQRSRVHLWQLSSSA